MPFFSELQFGSGGEGGRQTREEWLAGWWARGGELRWAQQQGHLALRLGPLPAAGQAAGQQRVDELCLGVDEEELVAAHGQQLRHPLRRVPLWGAWGGGSAINTLALCLRELALTGTNALTRNDPVVQHDWNSLVQDLAAVGWHCKWMIPFIYMHCQPTYPSTCLQMCTTEHIDAHLYDTAMLHRSYIHLRCTKNTQQNGYGNKLHYACTRAGGLNTQVHTPHTLMHTQRHQQTLMRIFLRPGGGQGVWGGLTFLISGAINFGV